MRARLALSLALSLGVAACSSSEGTGVILTINGSNVTADQLSITARYGTQTITHTVPGTARALTFPTSVVVALPDRSTSVTLSVTATSGGQAVAGGATSAIAVAAHQLVTATVDLTPGTIPPDGGAGGCGKIGVLVDPLTTAMNDPLFLPYEVGMEVGVEGGGKLAVTLPAMAANATEAGFPTQAYYDMTGSSVSIEVPQMVDTSTTAYAGFAINRDDSDFIEISQESGTLNLDSVVNKGRTRLASTPYDPTAHRWWRIREDGGTVFLETSPDGATFTTRGMVSTPSWAAYGLVNIFAGADGTVNNGGEAHFDKLNNGIASGARCPADSLVDDFTDAARSVDWLPSTSNHCDITATDGKLDFALQPTPSMCEYVSSYSFDLTGNAVFVQAPSAPTKADGAVAWLRATVNELDQSGYEINVDEGTLQFSRKNPDGSSTVHATKVFNGNDDGWWRLREEGGTIFYETGPDGKTWMMAASEPVTLPVTAMRTHLGVSVYDKAATMPGHIDFANLNVAQP